VPQPTTRALIKYNWELKFIRCVKLKS
jgi:hypothetical protein